MNEFNELLPPFRYFGERWGSPQFDGPTEQVDTPVGLPCIWCREEFEEGDQGWLYLNGPAVHKECGLRSVAGGVNHLQGTCSCQGGGDDPDPEGMSKREAAQAVWDFLNPAGSQ